MPEISVLIPAYNAEKTIVSAVWSALNQSFKDIEVLVYVDGSTDKTSENVQGINDARVQLFQGKEHCGISYSRNFLLKNTSAPYIAWLDADDIMLPGRLSAQHGFLENHHDVDFLGCRALLRNSNLTAVSMGTDCSFLEAFLLFRNPFIQSSIMAKNFFSKENLFFDSAFDYTEDYDLYLRCLEKGKRFAMLPFYGVSYNMPGETVWKEKSNVHGLDEKLERLMLRVHKETKGVDVRPILAFIRKNNRIDKPGYDVIKRFLATARQQMCRKDGKISRGEKAVLLLYRFRLERNHRGIVPAFLWLLLQNPFTVRAMFVNRLRVR
jgi:glycosyltransferase involved in cell wall biosynthesis